MIYNDYVIFIIYNTVVKSNYDVICFVFSLTRTSPLQVYFSYICSVNIEKHTLHPLQKRYYMESGYDEDFVICPTLESIRKNNIPLPFRVNHSQFHPTHKLIWEPHSLDYPHSHYILEGIKPITSGTEISFDYNYGSVVYKL